MDAVERDRIVQKLLDDCEAAGLPRFITNPAVLARLSALLNAPRG